MVENVDWHEVFDAAMRRRSWKNPSPRLSTYRSALKLLWSQSDVLAKRYATITVLVVLFSAAASGIAPLLLKVLVDRLQASSTGADLLVPSLIVGAYAFFHWSARSLTELRNVYFGRTDQRVQSRLSCKLFEHVISLPLRFHIGRQTGALNQTLTNGLLGYRMVIQHLMLTVLPVLVELVAMCSILVLLDHYIFLAIICTASLLYLLVFSRAATKIRHSARAACTAHIDTHALLTDTVLNYETVRLFGGEAHLCKRFDASVAKTEARWLDLFNRKLENGLAVAVVFALSLGISMYIAVRDVVGGKMSIGDFVLVNAYILQITRPLEMIGFALRDIAQSGAFLEKLLELFDHEREEAQSGLCLPSSAEPPELAFEHVSCWYLPDRYILKDISFVIPSGKSLAVVGASGSGKSSLIRLLLRMIEPTAGTIRVAGISSSRISLSALRSAITVVPQDIALFNDSIAHNIAFGRPESTEQEITRAAEIAHIHTFIMSLPDGYRTNVGERGFKLSGGEKQRIAIARAVLKKPRIFVFDEATSSLDSETERAILDELSNLAIGATTVLIAHRLTTIVHADEIVVLHYGRIVERGTHSDLLARNGTYAAMWRAQHRSFSSDHAPSVLAADGQSG